jgi:Family of unknown function (DUF6174)
MPMQVLPGVAAMMKRYDDGHHYLRSISHLAEHHQTASIQNPLDWKRENVISDHGYNEDLLLQQSPLTRPLHAYHDKDDSVAVITTHTHTRALQAGNRTRNRYGDDGCDPAWARKFQVYLNYSQQVWADPICYSYELSVLCYCPPEYTKPMRIEVYNDTVTHYEFVDQDPSISAVIPDDRRRPTMNMLFQIAYEDCFEGCPDNGTAQECYIAYDSVYGHIELLSIDYSKLVADDEVVSTILMNGPAFFQR